MATIVNERDKLLQATPERVLALPGNFFALTASAPAFASTNQGATPSSIIIKAVGGLPGTVIWTSTPVKTLITEDRQVTINATEVAKGTSVVITGTLISGGNTYIESITIAHMAEGVTSSLSKSSLSLPADNAGVVASYGAAFSIMSVYVGAIDDSANWTYVWNLPAGVTTVGGGTRTIQVTNLVVDSIILTCTASKAGWPNQVRSFSLTKSRAGINGTNGTLGTNGINGLDGKDAISSGLTSYSVAVATNSAGTGGDYARAKSTMSVYRGATDESSSWSYAWTIPPGVSATGATTRNLHVTGMTVDSAAIDCTATKLGEITQLRTFVVVKARAGVQGTPGLPGESTTGTSGPRNLQVYFYYNIAQAGPPPPPLTSQVSYNFTTHIASVTATNWVSSFTPSKLVNANTAGNKYWAVRVTFSEASFGGAQNTPIVSPAFNWQNMDGLVTFTNLAGGLNGLGLNTTFIDGGSIITGSITVDKIKSGTSLISTGKYFSLGMGTVVQGIAGILGLENLYDNGSACLIARNDRNVAIAAQTRSAAGNGALLAAFANPSGNATTNCALATELQSAVFQVCTTAGTTIAFEPNNNTIAMARLGYSSSKGSRSPSASFGGRFENFYGMSGTTPKVWAICASSNHGFETNGSANILGGVGPFTGSHDALLSKSSKASLGDIVCDAGIFLKRDISNTITYVEASARPKDKAAVGVLSNLNAPIPKTLAIDSSVDDNVLQYPDEVHAAIVSHSFITMNSVGEGQVLVCGEGGNLEIGDLITTSSIRGKGMRQDDDLIRNYTVAKSRETVNFSSPSEIKLVACIYLCG